MGQLRQIRFEVASRGIRKSRDGNQRWRGGGGYFTRERNDREARVNIEGNGLILPVQEVRTRAHAGGRMLGSVVVMPRGLDIAIHHARRAVDRSMLHPTRGALTSTRGQ